MLPRTMLLGSCLAMTTLTGCGHTNFDRGVGGAGVGAATGAVVGAVTGLSVAQGALLGAAGGAIVGLATDSSQVNLGQPLWKKNASRTHYKSSSHHSSTVSQIQSGLASKGYNPGPSDGISGNKTRNAIRAYQRDHGLQVDGNPSAQLASHINSR